MLTAIFFAQDGDLAKPLGILQFRRYPDRHDLHHGAGLNESADLAGANSATADDHGANAFTVQRNRQIAHRNWPRLSDTMRKTTYSATTLAKVTADMSAA